MSNSKADAVFHPRTLHACTLCGSEYTSIWAAAWCCDPGAYADTDD